MTGLFETVAWNSLAAGALALLVLVAGRVWKRPELLHVLWLVVLVKLVTPGLVRLDTLPAPGIVPAGFEAPAPFTLPAGPEVALAETGATAAPLGTGDLWVALWVGGSLVLLMLAALQCTRFARVMRSARPPDPVLRARVETLARRVGVEAPRVRVVDAPVPPLVWAGLGRGNLALPARLLERLEPPEADALLTHELAHLKRRDPWIRWIELAVTASLWWNPLVWWVRRKLRRAEELACDRWVLDLLPGSQRAYADAIVKTVEFLAGRGRPPVLATGVAGTRHIKERLTMILKPAPHRRLRHPLLPALLLALLALPVVPGFADRDRGDDAAADRARAEILELEKEARELEHRLQAIRDEQLEIEMQLDETRIRREAIAVKTKAEALRRAGRTVEAAELEARRTEDHARVEEYERAAAEFERAHARQAGAREEARRAYEKALQSGERERRVAAELEALMEQYSRLAPAEREAGAEAQRLALHMRKLQHLVEAHASGHPGSVVAEREALEREIDLLTERLQELELLRERSGDR